tara:strand:- start:359 stop:799 length:441 start_codon:yes stop_codon:yes gene_type:complete
MSVRFQRLLIIFISFILLSISVALILSNSKKNIIFFYTPTELINSNLMVNEKVRIGGFVKKGSFKKKINNNKYLFIITDNKNDIEINFEGILPDLFKEDNGAVIEGMLTSKDKIVASKVFAKHDENYMPAAIKKQLEKADYWKKRY